MCLVLRSDPSSAVALLRRVEALLRRVVIELLQIKQGYNRASPFRLRPDNDDRQIKLFMQFLKNNRNFQKWY